MRIPDEFELLTQEIANSIAAARGAAGFSTEHAMGRLGEYVDLGRKIFEFESAFSPQPKHVRSKIAEAWVGVLADIRQLLTEAAAEQYWDVGPLKQLASRSTTN